MIKSKALLKSDFETSWYKHWAKLLKQDEKNRGDFALKANKFWQNAIMAQALYERGVLNKGFSGLGFGVGKERLPALFASKQVKITATDQDFKTQKASSWDNGQLAHGSQSLNAEGICPQDVFNDLVNYRAVDMKNIPSKLFGLYDFIWSNCALGHLGSIDESKHFIENSLECLKPGGWAVHTTEANILSNTTTLDNKDTVFFRQIDLFNLFKHLSESGYIVSSLNFNLGSEAQDKTFTLFPKWGSDYSKILYDGYMATQILLIIHKPVSAPTHLRRKLEVAKHRTQYYRNLFKLRKHLIINTRLSQLMKHNETANSTSLDSIKVHPIKSIISTRLGVDASKEINFEYSNNSKAGLFLTHGTLEKTKPIVLATYNPINRYSRISTLHWYEKNRPLIKLYVKKSDGHYESAEYIKPKDDFRISFNIAANTLKSGEYEEWFCLVREGDGPIPSTEVCLKLSVI